MVNFRTVYRAKSPDGCDSFGDEGSPYGWFSTWKVISTRISAGSDIVFRNENPVEKNISLERDGTYMEGFDPVQRGEVGDMTAGLRSARGPKNLPNVSRRNLRSSGKKTVSRVLSGGTPARCCNGLRREDRCGRTLLSVRRPPLL